MPFKRYQIQPVWRADQPQIRQGRFREFYQCDVDTVGAGEGVADAEILALTVEMMERLGFSDGDRRARVQLNHRRLLEAICAHTGLPGEKLADFTRALDKLDKIGRDGVREELEKVGVAAEGMARLDEVLAVEGANSERLAALEGILGGSGAAEAGLEGLRTILEQLHALGVEEEMIVVNPHLARGLDYYTGAVFETTLPAHPHIGSLTGGGRYDELIGLYSGRDLPAVGTTIGLDRIIAAMKQLDMLREDRSTVTRLLLAAWSEAEIPVALGLLRRFREAGIPSELFPATGKLKKPFSYADKQGIGFVGVIGPDEAAAEGGAMVSLKQLATGEQDTVTLEEAVRRVKLRHG
jgi:histidyl-tRNA synthetase